MRRELLRYLACPSCGGELAAEGQEGISEIPIEDGTLRCETCATEFPVRGSIARFVTSTDRQSEVTRRTSRVYDFTWQYFGEREVRDDWEKDSYCYLSLIPQGLLSGGNKVGLEAGCGGGADLLRVAAGGATIVGFDLSAGVDVAYQLVGELDNVEVVQGDLHDLPFKPGEFDFIYSFGVLHHLPDTQSAFVRLAKLLKPGAPLITYLYGDRSERRRLDHWLLGVVRAVRRVTSRLPPRVLHAACWALFPPVWLLCAAPAAVMRRLAPQTGAAMPFSHTLRPFVLVADLYDRFASPVERRFSEEQVRQLYGGAGFERVECRQYRGWVSWGFKPSERSA